MVVSGTNTMEIHSIRQSWWTCNLPFVDQSRTWAISHFSIVYHILSMRRGSLKDETYSLLGSCKYSGSVIVAADSFPEIWQGLGVHCFAYQIIFVEQRSAGCANIQLQYLSFWNAVERLWLTWLYRIITTTTTTTQCLWKLESRKEKRRDSGQRERRQRERERETAEDIFVTIYNHPSGEPWLSYQHVSVQTVSHSLCPQNYILLSF